jgi:hypothetical protein
MSSGTDYFFTSGLIDGSSYYAFTLNGSSIAQVSWTPQLYTQYDSWEITSLSQTRNNQFNLTIAAKKTGSYFTQNFEVRDLDIFATSTLQSVGSLTTGLNPLIYSGTSGIYTISMSNNSLTASSTYYLGASIDNNGQSVSVVFTQPITLKQVTFTAQGTQKSNSSYEVTVNTVNGISPSSVVWRRYSVQKTLGAQVDNTTPDYSSTMFPWTDYNVQLNTPYYYYATIDQSGIYDLEVQATLSNPTYTLTGTQTGLGQVGLTLNSTPSGITPTSVSWYRFTANLHSVGGPEPNSGSVNLYNTPPGSLYTESSLAPGTYHYYAVCDGNQISAYCQVTVAPANQLLEINSSASISPASVNLYINSLFSPPIYPSSVKWYRFSGQQTLGASAVGLTEISSLTYYTDNTVVFGNTYWYYAQLNGSGLLDLAKEVQLNYNNYYSASGNWMPGMGYTLNLSPYLNTVTWYRFSTQQQIGQSVSGTPLASSNDNTIVTPGTYYYYASINNSTLDVEHIAVIDAYSVSGSQNGVGSVGLNLTSNFGSSPTNVEWFVSPTPFSVGQTNPSSSGVTGSMATYSGLAVGAHYFGASVNNSGIIDAVSGVVNVSGISWTMSATQITNSSVELNISSSPYSLPTSVQWFSSTTPVTVGAGLPGDPAITPVSTNSVGNAILGGLTAGTTYYFYAAVDGSQFIDAASNGVALSNTINILSPVNAGITAATANIQLYSAAMLNKNWFISTSPLSLGDPTSGLQSEGQSNQTKYTFNGLNPNSTYYVGIELASSGILDGVRQFTTLNGVTFDGSSWSGQVQSGSNVSFTQGPIILSTTGISTVQLGIVEVLANLQIDPNSALVCDSLIVQADNLEIDLQASSLGYGQLKTRKIKSGNFTVSIFQAQYLDGLGHHGIAIPSSMSIDIITGNPNALYHYNNGSYVLGLNYNSSSNMGGYFAPVGPSGFIEQSGNFKVKALDLTKTTSILLYPSYSVNNQQGGSGAGWNLIGNTMTCGLDWSLVNPSSFDLNSAVYIWDPATNDYKYWASGAPSITGSYIGSNLSTSIIPPLQAFWVQKTSQNYSQPLNLTSKDHGTVVQTSFFKNSNNAIGLLFRDVADSNVKDFTWISDKSGATAGFDGQSDAWKMYKSTLGVYSQEGESKMAINSIDFGNVGSVDVGLNCDANSKLVIKGLDLSQNGDVGLLIEDRYNSVVTDLKHGDYIFHSGDWAEDGPRFRLHVNTVHLGEGEHSNFEDFAYVDGSDLIIASTANDYKVYDAVGAQVYSGRLVEGRARISKTFARGLYTVQLSSSEGLRFIKILIP